MLILNFSPLRFYGLFPLRFALSVYLPNALSIVSLALSLSLWLSVLYLLFGSVTVVIMSRHILISSSTHGWPFMALAIVAAL